MLRPPRIFRLADGAEPGDRRGGERTGHTADMSALPVIPMQDPRDRNRPTPISHLPLPEGARPPLALWVENLSVSFDGFKALTDVTLTLEKGELRCLIGPNGAGKTTLMDCITGKTRPEQRRRLSGEPVDQSDQALRGADRPARHRGASCR